MHARGSWRSTHVASVWTMLKLEDNTDFDSASAEVPANSRGMRRWLVESPALKTFFSVVIPVSAAVLSGSFIVEISGASGLQWTSFYQSKSFYGLVVLSVLMYFYNRLLYTHENQAKRFLDSDYCIAYMRSKCLPEAADRYRELIRTGGGGELRKAMEELEEILR